MTERPQNQPGINIDLITPEFLEASRQSFFELFSDPDIGGISDNNKIGYINAVFNSRNSLYDFLNDIGAKNKKFDLQIRRQKTELSFVEAFPDQDPNELETWLFNLKLELEANQEQDSKETQFHPAVAELVESLGGEVNMNIRQFEYLKRLNNPQILRILLDYNEYPENKRIGNVTFSDLFATDNIDIFRNWVKSTRDKLNKKEGLGGNDFLKSGFEKLEALRKKITPGKVEIKKSQPKPRNQGKKFSRRHVLLAGGGLLSATIGSRFIGGSTQSPSLEKKTQVSPEKVITNADEAIKLLFESPNEKLEFEYSPAVAEAVRKDPNMGKSMQMVVAFLRQSPVAVAIAASEGNIIKVDGKFIILPAMIKHIDPGNEANNVGPFSLQGEDSFWIKYANWFDKQPKGEIPISYIDPVDKVKRYYPHTAIEYQLKSSDENKSLTDFVSYAIKSTGGLTLEELYYFTDLFNQGGIEVGEDALKFYIDLTQKFSTRNDTGLMLLSNTLAYWSNKLDKLHYFEHTIGALIWNKAKRLWLDGKVTGREVENAPLIPFLSPATMGSSAFLGSINESPRQQLNLPFKAKVVSKFTTGEKYPEIKQIDIYDKRGYNNPESTPSKILDKEGARMSDYLNALGVGNVAILYSQEKKQYLVYTNLPKKTFEQLEQDKEFKPSDNFELGNISGNLGSIPSVIQYSNNTATVMPGKSIGLMIFSKEDSDKLTAKQIEELVKEKGHFSLTTPKSRLATELGCVNSPLKGLGSLSHEIGIISKDDGSSVNLEEKYSPKDIPLDRMYTKNVAIYAQREIFSTPAKLN